MSAYGTKKPGSDFQLQLSFPSVYEAGYAELGLPLRYAPEVQLVAGPFPAGTSEMDQYHNQKMMDAHRRVMNGVADTKRAIQRALVSHAGYWKMPDAVLGQRVYANPSLGSGAADIYKPLTRMTPGLTGGVLRSAEGQQYGKKLLDARIAQLNAIDEASAGLESGFPITDLSIPQAAAEEPAAGSMVKVVGLLNTLINALESGIRSLTNFVGEDFFDLIVLLFRIAPTATREDLQNIQEALDLAARLSRDVIQEVDEVQRNPPARFIARQRAGQWRLFEVQAGRTVLAVGRPNTFATEAAAEVAAAAANQEEGPNTSEYSSKWAETIATSVPILREYVARMLAIVNRSPADRLAASKAAIRDLGLTKYRTQAQARARAEGAFERQQRRDVVGEEAEAAFGAEPENIPVRVTGQGRMRGPYGAEASTRIMSDKFDMPAIPREDEEQLNNTANWIRDEREVFGDNSGLYYGQQWDIRPDDIRDPGARRVAVAAQMGMENPYRAMAVGANERSTMEYTQAKDREAPEMAMPGAADRRKAQLSAAKQAAKAAQEAAKATMDEMLGKGKKKWIQKAVKGMKKGAFTKQALRADHTPAEYAEMVLRAPEKHTVTTRRRAQFVKNVKGKGRRGGMNNEPPQPPMRRRLDAIGHEREDAVLAAEAAARRAAAEARRRAEAAAAKKRAERGPAAEGGKKLKLINQAGKTHRGAYHQMEDGTYHSGAKHTKRSKPLTPA
jgi:hypothetical protein